MKTLAALIALTMCGASQSSGGGGSSTSRFASPAVVASWVSHQSNANGATTTLLVLWRGTPGWFSKPGAARGARGGGGSFAGAGQSGSYAYEYFSHGGLTFMLEFDYDKSVVKMLDQEISLKETNVVLVDFVDSPKGPSIVDRRWIDPADDRAGIDPIAATIKRSPDLYDYLRCDLTIPDKMMQAAMPIVCAQMRP